MIWLLDIKKKNAVFSVLNKAKMRDEVKFNSPAQDGDKRHPAPIADGPLLGVVDGQHDRDRHVDDGAVSEAETVEMKRL